MVKHFVPTPPDTPKNASQTPEILLDDASDTLSILSNADSDASIRALSDKFKNIAMTTTTTTSTYVEQNNGTAAIEHLRQLADNNDLSSIDFEQNSETESCDQNNYFDETTYTLASPPAPIAKPKIVIPMPKIQRPDDTDKNSGNSDENMPEPKAIRGRKKPAYVSPYRRTMTANSAPAVNRTANLPMKSESKKTVVSKLSPKTQTVVAKTHVLINKTTLTNKMKNGKSTGIAKVGLSGKRNVPDKSPKSKSEDKPILERQGTFVKDEPTTNGDVPIVNSSTTAKSQPTSPAKSKLPSKLPTGKSMIPTSPSKSASAANAMQSKLKPPSPKIQSNTNGFIKPATVSGTSRPGTAASSASSSSTDLSKRRTIGYFRSPSTPNVPQRSNSNTSLKSPVKRGSEQCSTQPPSRSNSNLMQSKRNGETTTTTTGNRLSNLWKKDSPSATKLSGKSTGTPPTGKLIRSSTFDTTPIDKRTTQTNKTNQSNRQIETETTPSALKRPVVNVSSVVHRVKSATDTATAAATATKRLSRLNSFINVDE